MDDNPGTPPDRDDDAMKAAFLQQLFATMVRNHHRAEGDSNEELVSSLKDSQVLKNEAVEHAMLKIPRGEFVPEELQDQAYVDSPMRLPMFGFNISAPHMYAMCLQALELEPGHSFLDIGSGCGHMTALGGFLVGSTGRSDGLDLLPEFIKFAEDNVRKFCEKSKIDLSNVHFEVRNCFVPDVHERLYDRIHVGACCPVTRKDQLVALLKPGGICVTPMSDHLVKIKKKADGTIVMQQLASVRYGDLKIPSDAEVREAQLRIERKKATTIIVPPNTYESDFALLLQNKEFSDVILVVDGHEIPAHKLVLQVRCEHFRAMFRSGLRESASGRIVLEGSDYKAFLGCLAYIYTGTCPIPDADTAIELIAEANKLQLERLKALCEEKIAQAIDIENAAYVYQVASRHAGTQLRKVVLDCIMSHYDEVCRTKSFGELDRDLLLELTQEACKLLRKTRDEEKKEEA